MASSRETLADAASELFLEQGYDTTTVADITTRAGVSRSSFFNYFDGKAATIWFALDEHLDAFYARLEDGSESDAARSLQSLARALGEAPPHTLALAITNAQVMGVEHELETGSALRQAALGRALAAAAPQHRGADALRGEIAGAAQAAAVFGAVRRWAERGAGTTRLDREILAAMDQVPSATAPHGEPLRVAVIGSGAIGARVISELVAGTVPGATLAGVVTRRAGALSEALGDAAARLTDFGDDLDRAVRESDLVAECAGIEAARTAGGRVIALGGELLIVSIGALADAATRASLTAGPGRLRLATGAIGGLDLLASAARPDGIPGGIERAAITSTKSAPSLVQTWMEPALVDKLTSAQEPFTLFEGSVAEAVRRYPGSLNVACALAHATGLWDDTVVRLVADPTAQRTTHEIVAGGAAGDYRFEMTNAVSEQNPTSSAVVAEAVLRGIGQIARPSATFV